jgi:glucokinase
MTPWRIGVDVGGTKIATGLVAPDGRIRGALTVPTPATQGPDAILDAIGGCVLRLRETLGRDEHVTGVGIGTGGVVDHTAGVIVSATGLLHGWAGTPVAQRLSTRLGLPVAVDNDGNAFALGEHLFGAGRGLSDVVYVAVGTGIGGAIVLGGRLRRSPHHTAGELGHLSCDVASSRPCSCGSPGHLEAVASGPAIVAAYGDPAVTDLRVVTDRAAAGDTGAAAAIARGAAALGRALAGLAGAIDPEAVVLGGGVAQLGEFLWTPLAAAFRGTALPGLRDLPLLPAELGPHSAVVGAAQISPPSPATRTLQEIR